MVIDFHAHAFPDALAPRAMAGLTASAGEAFPPCHNGTVEGLINNMNDFGIDVSVLQPVITKQKQTETLNLWAKGTACDKIIPFGGIYPHTDDFKRDIDYVCSLGLKGLKFHPEYQEFSVDEDRFLKIYDYALSKGLILLFHAGFDIAYQPPYRSSPKAFRRIVKAMGGGVIVAAHLGGMYEWEETAEQLGGTGIYLDTSMGFTQYSGEQFMTVAKAVGTDRLLFATDAPWSHGGKELERLRAMPLTAEELSAIEGGNAARILEL